MNECPDPSTLQRSGVFVFLNASKTYRQNKSLLLSVYDYLMNTILKKITFNQQRSADVTHSLSIT